ncbi:hypothetical protein QWZ10_26230 [Paracoccus cavernae]|uniref:Uncharacterized protein n=1 Tax=Paracoccus cavernae TaxID=1571207 RepID=A0ABT8DDJ0_9RHOB|nr:hypothetical protein [Paracoccus cavernae]MDN3714384.1 hypothetical protein [Paracoccus cavernae]MDN3714433.1 hypothetical protein [Paracoccus cavernae]
MALIGGSFAAITGKWAFMAWSFYFGGLERWRLKLGGCALHDWGEVPEGPGRPVPLSRDSFGQHCEDGGAIEVEVACPLPCSCHVGYGTDEAGGSDNPVRTNAHRFEHLLAPSRIGLPLNARAATARVSCVTCELHLWRFLK